MELLCKASTVVFESLGCRKALKGIYLNLLHIVTKSTDLKVRQRRSPQGTEPPESPHPLPLPFLPFAACLAAAFQQLGFEREGLGTSLGSWQPCTAQPSAQQPGWPLRARSWARRLTATSPPCRHRVPWQQATLPPCRSFCRAYTEPSNE